MNQIQTGMRNFELLNEVVALDELCEKHKVNLLKFKDVPEFCPECRKEEIEIANIAKVKYAEEKSLMRRTVEVLAKDSVYSDITIKDASFENYKTDDGPEEFKAKEFALDNTRKYYQGEIFTTVLAGNTGVGKSHLAMSMLRKLNENNKGDESCLFVSLDQLLRRIRNSYNDEKELMTEERALRIISDVTYLVIDDIGAELGSVNTTKVASDFVTRVLNAIVDSRQGKANIITTNLTNNQINFLYGSRIYSRLLRDTDGHRFIFKEAKDKRFGGMKDV